MKNYVKPKDQNFYFLKLWNLIIIQLKMKKLKLNYLYPIDFHEYDKRIIRT